MFTIDKSKFTAEQLAQYEELIAIGKADVDPAAAKKEMEGEEPADPSKEKTKKAEVEDMDETKKSDTPAPELQAALDELANLKKSFEMKEMTDVAKKYAALGKNEEELAKTLYDMKKSNEANYNAYIAILDESLDIVNKSGLFTEVGKSAGGQSTSGGAVAKVEAKAREIQKSDPNTTWDAAIAKAWQDPALAAEYDAEYFGQ